MGRGGQKGSRGRRLSPNEDAERYLAGYPDLVDDPTAWDNVRFYKGEIKSRSMAGKWPEDYVDTIHTNWLGDYELLERHHSWVQWLFPIREQGVNRDSQPLTVAERDEILKDEACVERLLTSYKFAMDFYGFEISDDSNGYLTRTASYRARFANLNAKKHNFLRLTRILKWLGEFDLSHFQVPLIHGLLCGVFEPPQLLWDMRKSLIDYFIPIVKDAKSRERLTAAVQRLDNVASSARQGDARATTVLEEELRALADAQQPVAPSDAVASNVDEPNAKRHKAA